MSILDQLTALPVREVKVRAKKDVPATVKIVENPSNELKPKVKLSSSSLELVKSENEYIFLREFEGSLYIVTPSPFSLDGVPNKNYDTRIGKTGRLEITRAVINSWRTNLSDFIGEYNLVLVEEKEIGTTEGVNKIVKTFKLEPVITTENNLEDGNSNQQPESTEEQATENGVSHDADQEHGSESGVGNTLDFTGGSDGSDFVLSEDSIFA